MSVTSTRYISITFEGDVTGTQRETAASNAASAGAITYQSLTTGNNTIAQPAGGLTAVTIVPDSTNTFDLILKGDNADTGIPLHHTDPSSIALGSSPTIVINAAGSVGVRFIWS